jgi:hypothetical protein
MSGGKEGNGGTAIAIPKSLTDFQYQTQPETLDVDNTSLP